MSQITIAGESQLVVTETRQEVEIEAGGNVTLTLADNNIDLIENLELTVDSPDMDIFLNELTSLAFQDTIPPANQRTWREEQFIVNATTKVSRTFTIAFTPVLNSTLLFFNGLYMNKFGDYVLTSMTYTLDSAISLEIGDIIIIKYQT